MHGEGAGGLSAPSPLKRSYVRDDAALDAGGKHLLDDTLEGVVF